MSTVELIWGTTKLMFQSILDEVGYFALGLPGFYTGMLLTAAGMGLAERVLRRRGMLPAPRSRYWFLVAPFLVLCPTCAVIVFNHTHFSSTFANNAVGYPLGAVLGSSLILLACIVLRTRRRTGPRGTLNAIGIRCLNALAVATVLLAPAVSFYIGREALRSHGVERWTGLLWSVPAFFAVLMTAGFFTEAADRLKSVPAQAVVTPRTLYLRPFESEHQPFGQSTGQDSANLETALAAAMPAKWLPFVTLGNPTDRIAPSGAVRVYLPDTGWKDVVTRMISDARCVLAVPSTAPSTLWEFTHIRLTGQQQKLFVLTPLAPTTRAVTVQSLDERWLLLVVSLFLVPLAAVRAWARGPDAQPFQSWQITASALAAAGYLPGEDPGPGSLVSFDQEGRTLLVATGITSVRGYLRAADRHLAQREEPQRG
ncbi:hypothetical protein ACFZCL_35415 [Streptomyces sp. NPDC008159]|uniref:hypothetical protein n=1 Tax=Streptomyces sp. NPDC008159 TaxID=3364817 RepID=UPI0036E52AFE